MRIVVAADNRSLSLGLAGLDYEVVDVDPTTLSNWSGTAQSADVLVVGVDDPATAVELVRAVDELRPGMPSLVVCGDSRGWAALPVGGLTVEMLPLPVTRPSLVAAIERLTQPMQSPGPSPVPTLQPAEADVTVDPPEPAPTPARRIVAARSTNALRERLASTANDHAPRVSTPTMDDELTQLRPRPQVREPAPPVAKGVHDLVRAMLERTHEFYDVRDAARAVLEEIAAAADLAAAALLLPDGALWRVCAAVGARPLEWRYVLEPDSWIVATVVDGDRGVIVEESDIARQRLGGAPLAHHQHLMLVPVRGPRGVIVLGRESAPFNEADLAAVAAIAVDAGPVLTNGLALRELARALSEFRGLDE